MHQPVCRIRIDPARLDQELNAVKMSLGGGEVDGGAAVVVTHIEIDVLDVRIKVIPIKNNSYILIDLTCSHDLCRALMSPEHAARSI